MHQVMLEPLTNAMSPFCNVLNPWDGSAALGFLLMAWPVLFDAAMTVMELGQSLQHGLQRKAGTPQPYTGVGNDSPSQPVDTFHKLQS